MKKLFVMLVALIGFGISANAQVSFRTTQKLCDDKGYAIEFYRDGTCVYYNSDNKRFEGTYTLTNNNKEIVIKVGCGTYRATLIWADTAQTRVLGVTIEGRRWNSSACR